MTHNKKKPNQKRTADEAEIYSFNDPQSKKQKILETVCFNIRKGTYGKKFDSFDISFSYSPVIKMEHVLNKITKEINQKLKVQKSYYIYKIYKDSFIGKVVMNGSNKANWKSLCLQNITEFPKDKIIKNGLVIDIKLGYTHNIKENDISCEHIKKIEEKENTLHGNQLALKCPIYNAMKLKYEFSENGLNHIENFTHFKDEYTDKTLCKYGKECRAFIRLENGLNRLDDRCHVKLFRHPPRNRRQINMPKNFNKLIVNTEINENKNIKVHFGVEMYLQVEGRKSDVEFVQNLIDEVICNGYKYDLCLVCSKDDQCKHDVTDRNNENNLLFIVDQKMNHIRHRKMGKPLEKYRDCMLALLLYTGCECNYDLCSSQRSGDYKKWKHFDYSLFWSIYYLNEKEHGLYKLYSGLESVRMNKNIVENGFFPTYTSASWIREVSEEFVGKKGGMILEIDSNARESFYCCDVSWISKFQDEAEVLIARTVQVGITGVSNKNNFVLSILEEQKGVQTVLLKQKQK